MSAARRAWEQLLLKTDPEFTAWLDSLDHEATDHREAEEAEEEVQRGETTNDHNPNRS